MSRQPVVFGDSNAWGSILNDYLSQSLDAGGLLKSSVAALTAVNVKDPTYGATGNGSSDDTIAIQSAINAAAGRIVYVPAGTYVITSPLTYNTSGDTSGLKIIGEGIHKTNFDNRVANNPMISIDGSGIASQFQYGGHLEGFTIMTTTAPVNSDGIKIKSSWTFEVRRVRIDNLTGNGIVIVSTGDTNTSAYFMVTQCLFVGNDGYGIDIQDSALTVVHGEILRNSFSGNTSGGIRCSCQLMRFIGNSFANNGIGLHIKDGGGSSPRNAAIFDNEFQSNITSNCKIEYGVGIEGGRNHWNADDSAGSFRPPVSLDIGSGAGSPNKIHFSRDVVRVLNRGINPHTVFALGANASGVIIEEPFYSALDGATTFTDSGSGNTLDDVSGTLRIKDGVSTPATQAGQVVIYVDSADGDLKVKFGDGVIKTIETDT